ncbi:Hypp1859 [Branchiostoma lanceolatum]|uniref:Hypp1859 protein n=1 Tax=Branchiostoma lanceolatum TaxID=7740 RepID=A0A8K0EMM5_BRALA|nr:Hypp1859 [Branchiostoma lanceolatum]
MAAEDRSVTEGIQGNLYINTRYRGKMPYTKPKRSRLMARIMYKMKTVNVRKPTLPIATVFPHHYTNKHIRELPIRRTPVERESDEGGGCVAKGMKAEPIEFPEDLEGSFHAGQLQQHCSLAAKHCEDDGMLSQKGRWGYCSKPTRTICHSFKPYKGTTQSSPWPQRSRQTTQNNSSLLTSACKEDALELPKVADSSFYLSTDIDTGPQTPVSAELNLEQSDDRREDNRREDNRNWKNKKDSPSFPRPTNVDITCKEGIGENFPDKMVHPVLLEDVPSYKYDTCCMQNTNLGERESLEDIPSPEQLLSTEHDVKNNNVEEIIHSSLPGEEDNPPSPVFNSNAVLGALNTQANADENHKNKKMCTANGIAIVTEHCGFKISSCADEGLVPKETFWKEVMNDNYSDDSEPPFPLTQKYQEIDGVDDCEVPDGDNLDSLMFPESPLLYSQHFED